MFCPVCHSLGGLGLEMLGAPATFYRNVTAENGAIEKKMILCSKCHAVFGSDISFMIKNNDADYQAAVNQDYYAITTEIDEISCKVDEYYSIISGFERFFVRGDTFVELGCGLGLLTRAAGRRFAKAIGLDLEVATASNIGSFDDNVAFVEHNSFVSSRLPATVIDALAAWHVIEHLPDPHTVLAPFLEKIVRGGIFFGQVPLLSEDYVIRAHHVFYRAETLIALLHPYGMEAVYLEKDETNKFLSFCFRKY